MLRRHRSRCTSPIGSQDGYFLSGLRRPATGIMSGLNRQFQEHSVASSGTNCYIGFTGFSGMQWDGTRTRSATSVKVHPISPSDVLLYATARSAQGPCEPKRRQNVPDRTRLYNARQAGKIHKMLHSHSWPTEQHQEPARSMHMFSLRFTWTLRTCYEIGQAIGAIGAPAAKLGRSVILTHKWVVLGVN